MASARPPCLSERWSRDVVLASLCASLGGQCSHPRVRGGAVNCRAAATECALWKPPGQPQVSEWGGRCPPQGDRSAGAGNVGRGDTAKEAGAFRLPQVERKAWKMSRIQVKALRGRRGQAGEKGRASGHPIQDVTRYCVKIHLGNAGDPLGRVSK